MIRLATMTDLPAVMVVVERVIGQMLAEDNEQWDRNYPAEGDFAADIGAGELFLWDEDGAIAGLMCLNERESAEYGAVAWAQDGPALVIHRMAVAVDFRGRGIGKGLFAFADDEARRRGLNYLKTDTHCVNDAMNGLMTRQGFVKRGEVNFPGKMPSFYCYDKVLV